MRCRVYWRDEVDGTEELAGEPAVLPEIWRQGSKGESHRKLNTSLKMLGKKKKQQHQVK